MTKNIKIYSCLLILIFLSIEVIAMNKRIYVGMPKTEAFEVFSNLSYKEIPCQKQDGERVCFEYKQISPFLSIQKTWIGSYYEIVFRDSIVEDIEWLQIDQKPIELNIKELYLE